MNKPFLILILAAATLAIAGGCISQRPPTQEGYSVPSPSVEMPKQEEATSTVVADTRPDCQRIEDDYTGPIHWLNSNENDEKASKRMDKYPINPKYDHLKGRTDLVGLLGWDMFARILTAADCSNEQVSRLMGDTLSGSYPIPTRFQLEKPSKALLDLLNNGQYDIYQYENSSKLYYGFDPQKATIKDVVNLKPFADEIKSVEEVG